MELPPKRLLLAIFLTALGTSLPFGFNLGVINLTQSKFENFVNESFDHEFHVTLDKKAADSMWSFIVSSFTLGGAVGGLITPFFAQKLGRKYSLVMSAVIMIVACVFMAFSQMADSYELFTAGRTVAGLSSGLGSCILSIYLSEISPIELRGFSGGFLEVFLVFGKLISLVLSLPLILGTEQLWPLLVSLPAIPCLMICVLLPFFPETPKHLKATNKDKAVVERAIRFYQGRHTDTKHVMGQIDSELNVINSELSLVAIMKNPVFRQSLILALVVRLGQEMTGITAIFNFSTGIFKELHFSDEFSMYNSIGIAAMSACVTTCAVFAVEHYGRRPLLVYGLAGTLLCDLAFLIFALINDYTGQMWAGYGCMMVLYIHVFLFSMGPGPVGWLIVPEFVPQVARAGVTSAGVFINWFSNLLVTAAFLPLKSYIGHYSFLMFIIPLSLCVLYLYKRLPETKDKEVSRITLELMEKARLDQDLAADVLDSTELKENNNSATTLTPNLTSKPIPKLP